MNTKGIKIVLAILLATASAFGQYVRKDVMVLRDDGRPASQAHVRVCPEPYVGFPCTNLASVFTATTGGAGTNPVVGDLLGNVTFYASPGTYTLEISGNGIVGTRVMHNVGLPAVAGTAGTGTVTSVGLNMPTGFTVTGSPVTGSGTLAVAFSSTPTGTGAFVKQDSPTFTTQFSGPLWDATEAGAPTNPAASHWRGYWKTGTGWCQRNSAGTETCMASNVPPLSAVGQLFGYSGTAPCAVAAPPGNGYILQGDSTQPCGLGWTTATAGGSSTPAPAICVNHSTVTFSNTASLSTFFSCTIAGGSMDVVDRVIHVKARGTVSTAATGPTFLLQVTVPGISLSSSTFTLPASLVSAPWSVECEVVRMTTGVSGTSSVACTWMVDGATQGTTQTDLTSSGTSGVTWDATVDQAMSVKGQFGTANASNAMSIRYALFEQKGK